MITLGLSILFRDFLKTEISDFFLHQIHFKIIDDDAHIHQTKNMNYSS